MRRRAAEDKDNNDHISQVNLNKYSVFDDYNTTSSLTRYDDDSGNFDGTSNRVTTNTPSGGGLIGFTGDASSIITLPDNIITVNQTIEYLNGSLVLGSFEDKFIWNKYTNAIFYHEYSQNGPLTGNIQYTKAGIAVTLLQPGAVDVDALTTFYTLWKKIHDGEITSFKVPIQMFNPGTRDINSVRTPLNRFLQTTVDADGGWAVIKEDGYFNATPRNNADNPMLWKNYYIGDTYISETKSHNNINGLQALPNFAGIRFWFGITLPTKTFDNIMYGHTAFGKLPFTIGGFQASAATTFTIYASGQQINHIAQQRYGTWTQVAANPRSYGVLGSTQGRDFKFRTR
jgi:hypothetical protein